MLFGEFYFDKAVNSVAKGKSLYTAAFKYSFIFSHQCFLKLASVEYNKNGWNGIGLYVYAFLMIANCGIYAIAWQKAIKKFSLSTAYANKSVSLLWSQIWAVIIFHENLSVQNIIGILVVLAGVWTVQKYE